MKTEIFKTQSCTGLSPNAVESYALQFQQVTGFGRFFRAINGGLVGSCVISWG